MKLALAVLLLASTPAAATTFVYGEGTHTCARWAADKRKGNVTDELSHIAWLSGFMSAFNMFGQGDGDALKLSGLNGAERWIDNFCRAHPKEMVSTATLKLVERLVPSPRR